MKYYLTSFISIFIFLSFTSLSAFSHQTFYVTNPNDNQGGSLRDALNMASKSNHGSRIYISFKDDIKISKTLNYSGLYPVEIHGLGQTVFTGINTTLIASSNGGDVSISRLNFRGPGGFSIENRGDLNSDGGKGIFIDIRDDQTGMVSLNLNEVKVSDVANHGIHVSDCNLADKCGGGGGGAGEGSDASITLNFSNVVVENVGNGKFDADGVRVDERGTGSIYFNSVNSLYTKVGADGVELDEGQSGSVVAIVNNSSFTDNGAYCNPDLLKPYMPKVDEAEFKDGEMKESDIPGKINGTQDDGCFEREVDLYDSGFVEEYEFGIDLDDGFDIDEAGPGSLRVDMVGSTINNNLDEGVDFDEEDAGGINVAFISSIASGNNDDGFKNSEEGDGSIKGLLLNVVSANNGGKGAVLEEEDNGSLNVDVKGTTTKENDDMDNTGLEIVQDGDGSGLLTIISSDISDGIDDEGVTIRN